MINYESINLPVAGKTVHWFNTDSQKDFFNNFKNRKELLIKYKWLPIKKIKYTFNKYGFRSDDFDYDTESILFLGCSHTFGVGLNVEDTFSYIISKELNLKLINLSVPASSTNTAYRLGSYWIPKLKPKIVIYAEPEYARLEIITNLKSSIINLGPSFCKINDLYSFYTNYWLSDDTNFYLNAEKNRLALEYICLKNNIKFVSNQCSVWLDYLDYARDLEHSGIESNIKCAENILKIL